MFILMFIGIFEILNLNDHLNVYLNAHLHFNLNDYLDNCLDVDRIEALDGSQFSLQLCLENC